ncbi:MAG: peptidylprolyl isomerase [Alphaproteobacteria bacterium]|nr:peptidylprolyl isomerase [Alphaproteobacteria bacterium]
MRLRILVASFALIAAAPLLAACDQESSPDQANGAGSSADAASDGGEVVAVVNGEEIYDADVTRLYESLPAELQQMPKSFMYEGLVERLIERKLIVSEAKKAGLADDPAIERQVQNYREELLQENWLVGRIEDQLTEERLQQAYEERIGEFESEPTIRARHILVETEERARELIEELNAGADFATLAEESSIGPTASSGGDLGYFTKEEMVAPFAEAAFELDAGAISQEPVQTQFGWHVIKVEEKGESTPQGFEELRNELRQQEALKIYDQIVEDLREGADVTKTDAVEQNSAAPALPQAPSEALPVEPEQPEADAPADDEPSADEDMSGE